MKYVHKWKLVGLLVAGLILINVLASLLPFQLDLTINKRYTLSQGSYDLLRKIGEPITLQFYVNRSLEGIPTLWRNYASRIEGLLARYEAASNNKIRVEIIDPKPDSKEEEEAIRLGLAGQLLGNNETFFLGIALIQADHEQVIPFLHINREAFLEYDISQVLYQVQQLTLPKLGLITSLDVFGDQNENLLQPQPASQEWIFVQQLRKIVEVEKIEDDTISQEVDVLAMIHPRDLSESLSYAIDQFLLSGKPVFIAVDPSSTFQRQQQPNKFLGGTADTSSALPQLLKKWGIHYNAQTFVADLDYAAAISMRQGQHRTRYPAWLAVNTFDKHNPVTAQLELLLLPEAGHFNLEEQSELVLSALVSSSGKNSSLATSYLILGNPNEILSRIEPTNEPFVIAGLVSGVFPTAFPEGKPPKATGENEEPEAAATPEPALKTSATTSTLLLVADTDFLTDAYSVQKINLLGFTAIQPLNDNLTFMLNSIEFLSGSQDLIGIRSKGASVRPFKRLRALEISAQQQYQKRLTELEQRLESVQQKIQTLKDQQIERGAIIASPEIREAIKEFRIQEVELRSERREIRKKLREDIEGLKRNLMLLSILIVPLLIVIGGGIYLFKRNQ